MNADVQSAFEPLATKELDPALPIFGDHFPNRPLYPAFLQLAWVRDATQQPTAAFQQVKFKRPAEPGGTLRLEVATSSRGGLRFQISDSAGVVTTGSLR